MAKRVSVDRWMFTVTAILVFIGLIMVFSASAVMAKERYGSAYEFLLKQLVWAIAGLATMFVAMRVDYRRLKHPAFVFPLVGFTTLLLISVFFLDRTHGTHRWFHLGPISFQPSELAKPALIFFLAWFLENKTNAMDDWRNTLLPAVAPTVVFLGLIVFQPDLGTALACAGITACILFLAGTAEDLGLLGALTVVVLFAIFLWRGTRVALRTQDNFGRFLAVGITSMIVLQAFINISVVLGLMPTKGIPLPFVSYGGSSLFVTLACVGVLLNITKQAE